MQTASFLSEDILTERRIFSATLDLRLVDRNESAEALTATAIICSFQVSDFRRILEEKPRYGARFCLAR